MLHSGRRPQVEELPKDLSDLAAENRLQPDQPANGDSVHASEAGSRRGDCNAPREFPSEALRITESIQPHTEDNMTPTALRQTLLYPTEVTPTHMDQSFYRNAVDLRRVLLGNAQYVRTPLLELQRMRSPGMILKIAATRSASPGQQPKLLNRAPLAARLKTTEP